MLPEAPDEREKIGRSMGFPDWQAMLVVLNQHRDIVSRHFEEYFPTRRPASTR
jgi:glutamate-ammonia-ligase adenylyltransferase